MLFSLADVEGYHEYLEWLSSRIYIDITWRAEVKALFEVNKPMHPLTQISSQQNSEPEGFFRMPDGESLGLVECAFVKYSFDVHHQKKACENACKNLFAKAQQYLHSGDDVLVVLVNSFKTPPSIEDAAKVFGALQTKVTSNRLYEARFGSYGYFERAPIAQELAREMSEDGLALVISKGGFISGGSNSDIRRKILRMLSEKRKQHKTKYSSVYKVLYFIVDCPPSVLSRWKDNELRSELKQNELLVCCATGASGGVNTESKIVLFAPGSPVIDFSNPFFTERLLS
jgi:hypothetical protein